MRTAGIILASVSLTLIILGAGGFALFSVANSEPEYTNIEDATAQANRYLEAEQTLLEMEIEEATGIDFDTCSPNYDPMCRGEIP